MDIDIVIQKAESILQQAHNYKSIEAQNIQNFPNFWTDGSK